MRSKTLLPILAVIMIAAVVVAITASITGYLLFYQKQAASRLATTIYIETLDDTATPIIPANTALPFVWQNKFSTAHDNQTAIEIHLLYGISAKASQNTSIGQWEISGIPPLESGMPDITIQVQVDVNGEVKILGDLPDKSLDVIPQMDIRKVPVKK